MRTSHLLILSVIAFTSMALPLRAQRDTVCFRGQCYIFATESLDSDELQEQVHLLKIQGGRSKWLLRHTTHAQSADCNSLTLELGGYAVSDSSITFYTVWMHTDQALAGISGVRKQSYHLSPQGQLLPGDRICAVRLAPQHPCLADLASSEEDMLAETPPASARADRKALQSCLSTELGAKLVGGTAAVALMREVRAALETEIQNAQNLLPKGMAWVEYR